MPIITFWSNNEKAIGQTVSISAAATIMAVERNYKILLISADYNNKSIENCFGAQESNKELIKSFIRKPQLTLDSGVNGLLKLTESNRLSPEVIHDYTKIVFKNRLEVLYSPLDIEKNKEDEMPDKFKNIIFNASRYYDYVFVDLKKGTDNANQFEMLKMSDVIVLNIEQNMKNIEELLTMKELENLYSKIIWNLCRYDKNSKYNSKNLVRNILRKQAVYETHYNTLVFDASQEGNLPELMLRFKTLKDEDENKEFFSEIEKLNEGILLKYQETRTKM